MTFRLEYHKFVNRWPIPASLALCGIFLLPLLSISSAQMNTAAPPTAVRVAPPTANWVAPPTATRVPPPTGASLGRNGFVSPGSISHPHHTHLTNNGHPPRHNANGTAYYPYVYALPVPYAVDVSDAQQPGNEDAGNQADPGGPNPADAASAQNQNEYDPSENAMADPAPEPPQPPTTLVFKDGHQLEVNNYAIVSQTLYDLTPGHPRKIALSDLDLPATEKQNDDHGILFQLPPSSQAN
jgi:hypothetical protein